MEFNFQQQQQALNQQTNAYQELLNNQTANGVHFQNNLNSISHIYQLSHFLQPFFYRVNRLESEIQHLKIEITDLKKNKKEKADTQTATDITADNVQGVRRTYPISKDFSKHILCPVQGCRRKYSSKIAMRAHIRKNHKEVHLN